MYPFFRMVKEMAVNRRAPRLALTEWHVSRHICWPWDLDFWFELNNGRTLTLFDLGRVPMALRTGLIAPLKRRGWAIAVAGSSVRYRLRVRAFDRLTMYSRCVGWDARFFYMEQSLWRGGDCTSHVLVRNAVTSATGMVPTALVLAEMGQDAASPDLPDWVAAWVAAEGARPWPPVVADGKPPKV